jgi:hypothetical protein
MSETPTTLRDLVPDSAVRAAIIASNYTDAHEAATAYDWLGRLEGELARGFAAYATTNTLDQSHPRDGYTVSSLVHHYGFSPVAAYCLMQGLETDPAETSRFIDERAGDPIIELTKAQRRQ